MTFPNDITPLPDPAARTNTIAALKTHLTEIFGTWRTVITALQTKVGVNNSTDQNSLDYKVARKADLVSGLVPANQLASTGVAGNTTFLRGDRTWGTPSGGGGGTALTVQEEGVALATDATVLNFTGTGVTASGTGSTKTITIAGGGGGGGVTDHGDLTGLADNDHPQYALASSVATDAELATHAATYHGALTVQEEGVALSTAATALNFVGAGVTATGTGATKTVTIPGGSGSGTVVQDENATAFAARSKLRFTGAGVTATDDSANDRINITIDGGGGGGGGTNYDRTVYFDSFAGADSTAATFSDAAMDLARAYIKTNHYWGCRLEFGTGHYKFAQPIDFNSFRGVTVTGAGNQVNVGIHDSGTTLEYTGPGPIAVDARSSIGLVIENMTVSFSHSTFTGTLIEFGIYSKTDSATFTGVNFTWAGADLSQDDVGRRIMTPGLPYLTPGGHAIASVTSPTTGTMYVAATQNGTSAATIVGGDTGYGYVRDANLCGRNTRGGTDQLGGPYGSGRLSQISLLLGFKSSIICGVERTSFHQGGRAIDGTHYGDIEGGVINGGWSNVIFVRDCTFSHLKQAFIWNAGQSWDISGNTFEAHAADPTHTGTVPNNEAYDEDPGGGSQSVIFAGNWCGDGTPNFWIRLRNGKSWEIHGNYFASFADAGINAPVMTNPTPASLLMLVAGASITGNHFRGTVPPFNLHSDVAAGAFGTQGVLIAGNEASANATAPLNYTGLFNVSIFANYWGAATPSVAPSNGWYHSDNTGTLH